VASCAPLSLLGSASITALLVGSAFAGSVTTPTTTPYVSSVDEDHTITKDGSVIVDGLTGPALVEINPADYSKAITNSGTLKATNATAGSRAGIEVTNTLSGSITNDGALAMQANGVANGTYRGINAGQVTATGRIENNSTITVDVSNANFANLRGIDAASVDGMIINRNILNVIAKGQNIVTRGIDTGDISGSAQNTGKITSHAIGGSSGTAYGMTHGVLSGSVSNSGTIDAFASATSDAEAYGIISSSLTGQLNNSGTLTIDALGGTGAGAYGVRLAGPTNTGTLNNSGTISVTAHTPTGGSTASAQGVYTARLDGRVQNSGTISVTALGARDTAAEVLNLGFFNAAGVMENTGLLTGRAQADGSANAIGLNMIFFNGSLMNAGTISLSAQGGDAAYAAGIRTTMETNTSSLINKGTISADATATNPVAFVRAAGLDYDNSPGGIITNEGTIAASAKSSFFGSALGMAFRFGAGFPLSGTITNTGTLSAKVTAEARADATGIEADTVSGTILNSGLIDVAANSPNEGQAAGISARAGRATARVINSGTINVVGDYRGNVQHFVSGIGFGAFDGTLDNSGTIRAISKTAATDSQVFGIGLFGLGAGGTLTHSGNIEAISAGGANSVVYGIRAGDLTGQMNITGDITAKGAETNYALFLGTGSGQLNIESSASLTGRNRVANHNVALKHVGESNVYVFEDAAPGVGTFATSIDPAAKGHNYWFTGGVGGANPVYAAVKGADFAANNELPFLISSLGNVLGSELSRSTNRPEEAAPPLALGYAGPPASQYVVKSKRASALDEIDQAMVRDRIQRGFQPFLKLGIAQSRSHDGPNDQSSSAVIGSLNGGFTIAPSDWLSVGMSLSLARSNASWYANDLSSGAVVVNGQGRADLGVITATFGAGFGLLSHENTRHAGGSQFAKGNYSSRIATAQFGLERDFALSDKLTITPAAKVLVGHHAMDAYSESGSDANASVAARETRFMETRLGARMQYALGRGTLTASANWVRQDSKGPSSLNVSMLDQTQSLALSPNQSNSFGELGLGYQHDLGRNSSLSLNSRVMAGPSGHSAGFSASYKKKF
jgi:hypothetical protein